MRCPSTSAESPKADDCLWESIARFMEMRNGATSASKAMPSSGE